LSRGGAEEKAYPGREGMMRWYLLVSYLDSTASEQASWTYGRSFGEYCPRTCSRRGRNSKKQLGHPLQKMIGTASSRSEKRAMK